MGSAERAALDDEVSAGSLINALFSAGWMGSIGDVVESLMDCSYRNEARRFSFLFVPTIQDSIAFFNESVLGDGVKPRICGEDGHRNGSPILLTVKSHHLRRAGLKMNC